MLFQIKEIVLWPRDQTKMPRRISFTLAGVNVISGASKTGKSAIIPIIDYCLGSDKCSIPVNTIRDHCSWFGIVVRTEAGEKLIARREPGEQVSTGEMYMVEAARVEIPRIIEQGNAAVEFVKRQLDRLAGLSNLGFDPDSANGFKNRPGFRDLLAFVFQPQSIVANSDVLFYRADTMEHREKLRTIFPYALGAVTPATLAKIWEMDAKTRDLKKKERELGKQVEASDTWKAELRNWVVEARDLGLLQPEQVSEELGEQQMIGLLREIVKKSANDSKLTIQAHEAASSELGALEREESEVAMELSQTRRRLEQITSLRGNVDEYTGSLVKQRDRLDLSRWLREHAATSKCPICSSDYGEARAELDMLCDALVAIEAATRQMDPLPAAFDKELLHVRLELGRQNERLSAVKIKRKSLEERNSTFRDYRFRQSDIDRFIGRADQALRIFAAPEPDKVLRDEIEKLQVAIRNLREQISGERVYARLEAARAKISANMSRIVPGLDAERPDDPAELNIQDLTIQVQGASGRLDYLWEIGSGANWLSYHVAATIALQQYFISLAHSPIPSLLVYDQPSQVYFPRRSPRGGLQEDPNFTDEDISAIRRVFAALGAATVAANPRLQIIVLDHAGSDVWGELPGVNLVEEWRGPNKLVPMDWIA